MEYSVKSVDELGDTAVKVLEEAGDSRVFLFYGQMGAGKTTFIKSLCAALDVEDSVSSPTFSIVNEYISPSGSVYHFDFYRIKAETEAFDLGYEDYFYSGNYCLIEWPEKISGLLPDKSFRIEIRELEKGERLIVTTKSN